MSTMLKPDEEGLAEAGRRLRAGNLVAFPTETVYGLGANALDESAVLKIFEYKGRPLTDPLIVHVPDADAAVKLAVFASPEEERAFRCLADAFWPGPLTMVVKACDAIPLKVTADTGWVGLRAPKLAVALDLLKEARVPVAAPSANRFGHVSPTTAQHVEADLGQHPIGILDGGAVATTCEVGIESTVLKVDLAAGQVLVYRRGGASLQSVQKVLAEGGFNVTINIVAKVAKHGSGTDKDLVAPGQHLTHYAPDVQTFLTTLVAAPASAEGEAGAGAGGGAGAGAGAGSGSGGDDSTIRSCVVIDFGGRLVSLKDHVLAYKDISSKGDVLEARASVFAALRWAEAVPDAKTVLLCDLRDCEGEHVAALCDRLFRAASGRAALVNSSSHAVSFREADVA